MHPPELRQLAQQRIPAAEVVFLPGTCRTDVVAPLALSGNIGIELGVAAGSFSAAMVRTGRFRRFWGVDAYADHVHDLREYKSALRKVGMDADYHLLRMPFDQALDLFPDHHFDFIYCDGYAHSGEEGGQTIAQWYRKLKPGGVMAGDDYDLQVWPLVVWAVHHAAGQLGVPVMVTDIVSDKVYNRFRSWYFLRPLDGPDHLRTSAELVDLGRAENQRVAQVRARSARKPAPTRR